MPLKCNIDAKGKLARLIWGVILLLIAAALAIWWAYPAGAVWPWLVTAAIAAAGAFAIFEARAGWCVVRAMGFKTRL